MVQEGCQIENHPGHGTRINPPRIDGDQREPTARRQITRHLPRHPPEEIGHSEHQTGFDHKLSPDNSTFAPHGINHLACGCRWSSLLPGLTITTWHSGHHIFSATIHPFKTCSTILSNSRGVKGLANVCETPSLWATGSIFIVPCRPEMAIIF